MRVFVTQARNLVRCASCAGEVVPDLPPLEERRHADRRQPDRRQADRRGTTERLGAMPIAGRAKDWLDKIKHADWKAKQAGLDD